MKLALISLTTVVFTSVLTWYITTYYYQDLHFAISEDIISLEIKLLEETKTFLPPCNELQALNERVVVQKDDYIMIWRLAENKDLIEKFVINDSFDSAYEQIENSCLDNLN